MENNLLHQYIIGVLIGVTVILLGRISEKIYLRYKVLKARAKNTINIDDEPFGFF